MVLLEEKRILQYMRDILTTYKTSLISVNGEYHHNTSYDSALDILKYGILSAQDMTKLGIHDYSKVVTSFENDDFHVNGSDGISLAKMNLTDLYEDEEEYNPRNKSLVDFIISSDVQAGRYTVNYGNEFITYKPITLDKIRALDIRLLKLIKESKKTDSKELNDIVRKFNYLKDLATIIETDHLDIPIREMSNENEIGLNTYALSRMPKVKIK